MRTIGFLICFSVLFCGKLRAEDLPATQPAGRLAPAPPALAPIDQAFLVNEARRALRAGLKGAAPEKPAYVPQPLRSCSAVTFVTLRRQGTLLGIGQSPAAPVLEAVATAATAALAAVRAKQADLTTEGLAACSLEIELIGPAQRIGTGLDAADFLAAHLEPAVDGIGVRVLDKDVYVRPSQILSLEPVCPEEDRVSYRCDRYRETVLALKQSLGAGATETQSVEMPRLDPARANEVVFFRFRTLHFWQHREGERPVELLAGLRRVDEAEITPERIDEIVRKTGRYIVDRQLKDGFFSYEYFPGRDRYNNDEQNWVRQAGVIWAISRYARVSGEAGAKACSDRAIAAMSAMACERRAGDSARYILTPDQLPKLGTTALFGLALLDAPQPERYAALARALGDGVRSLQTEGGQFVASFSHGNDTAAAQDYFPGEALLLMARLYDRTRDSRWREAMDRAFPFYLDYYRTAASPAFVGWQSQAYGQLARTTTLKRYAEFVYDMADRVLETQLDESSAILPIYAGSFDVYRIGRTGISTAPYMEGLNEALRTARAFGDKARAARYADALTRASRFILQLQIKPEEAYFMRSPEDALEAFRTSPADNSSRIDHAQHALSALMDARPLLWPAQKAPAAKPSAAKKKGR